MIKAHDSMTKISTKKALITGSAGFIGFHMSKRLLSENWEVCGIDGLTDYYDVNLKYQRNNILKKNKKYIFYRAQLEDAQKILDIFKSFNPDVVIHLAAQAGVRYSIEKPVTYLDSNLAGTFSILEGLRAISCTHFLMASTSSVYGGNSIMPYKEVAKADMQMSFYAATKKANENMSHSYSHLFNIPTTCFRFFTVYGPWGRPDMALFKFAKKIFSEEAIDVYNHGKMQRDFTYIDDLIGAIYLLIECVPKLHKSRKDIPEFDSISSIAPWRVVNIGSSNPVSLEKFLKVIEEKIEMPIRKNYMEIQSGDVPFTYADISLLKHLTGFTPKVSINEGIGNFIDWYKSIYF